MTDKEKAKAYDEAFNKAKTLYENANGMILKRVGRTSIPRIQRERGERIREVIKYCLDHVFTNNTTVFEVTKEQCFAWLEKQCEQKPADKVEPKFKVGDTMRTLQEANDGYTDGMPVVVSIDNEYYRCTNELIAIKDQDDYEYPPINRQKPAEWSEEYETYSDHVITAIKSYYTDDKDKDNPWREELLRWFKSLKDRYAWKPSAEHIVALNNAILLNEDHYNGAVLSTLRDQLCKLMED